MKLARRLDRRVASRANLLRRLAVKDQFRRGLRAEPLEERSLMASDVISGFLASTPSPYWNSNVPTDVNNDLRVTPMDALAVINALNADGIRQLPSEAGEGESRMFIDVNNDKAVTPMDALAVINWLNAEGAPPDQDDKVEYTFIAVRVGGDPTNSADILTSVSNNQQFELVLMAKDLREPGTFEHPVDGELPKARYVFNAYVDVSYEDSLTPVAASEVQNLAMPTTSSGTLTLNDPALGINVTTSTINFNSASMSATASAVAAALNASLGAGSVAVTVSGTNLRVQFIGDKFLGREVAELTTTASSVTVTEFRDHTAPASFNAAFTHSSQYANGTFKRAGTDLLDDIGGFSSISPTGAEILDPIEVVRVKMVARLPDGTPTATQTFTTNFLPAYANMDIGHETTVIGNLGAVPPETSDVAITEIAWNTLTLSITSGPVNAVPDSAQVNEDTSAGVVINVLGNDTLNPPASGPILLRSFTQPSSGGTVTPDGTGLKFTPAANFAGTATFTYTAGIAGNTQDATGTVTVVVNPVNDPPAINTIANQNINEDTPATVNLSGIGPGGGADEANQTLTITATSSNPSVVPNPTVTYTSPDATGSLQISPAPDQSGTATITVTVTDSGDTANGGVNVTTRTFTVTVAAVNDAPQNRIGGVVIPPGSPASVIAPGTTFTFAGGSQLTVTDVDAGTANLTTRLTLPAGQGTLDVGTGTGVTVTGDGTNNITLVGPQAGINEALNNAIYTPGTGFTATLTFETTDNNSATTTSAINISRDPGVRPFAVNDAASTPETDAPAQVIIPVLTNDFVEAGRTNTVTIASGPSVGSATVNASNEIVYTTPGGDFFTPAGQPITFTYTLDDGVGTPSTGTVSVTITNVNDTPVGVADTFDAQAGQPNTIALPGVLANDTDVDGDSLTAVNASTPTGGTVTLNPNGSFVFNSTATGTFTFTYQARDPSGALSAPTTVTMRVSGPATATNDTATATEDTVFTSTTSVLANDDDGDPLQVIPLTATLVSNVPASAGSVTLNSDGNYTYNPAANFSGSTSFTYQANAGAKVSNVATVTITVTEVNDPPTAVNDTFLAVKRSGTAPNEVGVDQPVSVVGNDSIAPDTGETFSVTGIGTSAAGPFGTGPTATASGGSVRIVGGQILYTSPTTAPTTDSFFYEITDSRGGKASAQVSVDVVDFVPKVISGTVYIDSDNDGVIDASEKRLAGVEVTITGTDFTDAPVNVTVTTDIDGNYAFGAAGSNVTIKPPKAGTTYTLTQSNPTYLLNGLDTSLSTDTYDHDANAGTAEIPVVTNSDRFDSRFHLTWNVTDSGNAIGLNFAERGVDVSSLDDASGFIHEYLASSSGNGFVMATGIGGDVLWNWSLPGWENASTISATLSSDLTTLTITCIDKTNATSSTTLTQTPSATGARFRILGIGHNGQYIIRVDATAAEAGMNLLAAAPGSGGEGEAGTYAAGADALFAEQAWA